MSDSEGIRMSEPLMPKKERGTLVYRVSYKTTVRLGATQKALQDYLEAIGYKVQRHSPTMILERGSWLASWVHPNPRHQKSRLTLDFISNGEQTLVEAVLRVSRLGNVPLRPDYDFWQTELEELRRVLQLEPVNPLLSRYAAERALWYSVSVMLAVLSATILTLLSLVTLLLGVL